ncbi:Ig-like domain-containing protein [Xenorhabdus nematophila]|uniref:Ig-like domain-containing protein n=1 Tax=Xenorhabdus nematophila TaxID=628 RepID=UPI0003275504|nr:Ig-like domain-containing protein [Xenorhabdus nematophila]CCW32626.1 hypothetical protein XNC3_700056 [Xenorhabdus nematophila F1]
MKEDKINFISPLSSDILDVCSTQTITVKINDTTNDKMVSWLAFPSISDSKNVKFTQKSTPINSQGISVNKLKIKGKEDSNLLISVYIEDGKNDPDHYSAIYRIKNSRIIWNLDSLFCAPTEHYDSTDKESVITLTIYVVDSDNKPLKSYPLKFSGQPTHPAFVFSPDSLIYNYLIKAYVVNTDENGQAIIKIANTAPGIITLNMGTLNRTLIETRYVVFTNIGNTSGEESLLPPPNLPNDNSDGVLDLDKIRGNLVEITIPEISTLPSKISVWVNGRIAYVGDLKETNGRYVYGIDKSLFKTNYAYNFLAYTISYNDGNGCDSETLMFKVTGSITQYEPDCSGSLSPPQLVIPGVSINYSHIVGGLKIKIPYYENIEIGDEVVVDIYLNAYFMGSNSPKTAHLESRYIVSEDDLDNDFIVLFQQSDLQGFTTSENGKDGVFQAQYTVVGKESSQILILPLNTVSG